MPRVALVCEPPAGGVPEHVAQLARGLPEHGYEAVVFGPPEMPGARQLPFVRDYAHPHRDALALARLLRAAGGFDLVHAHAAKAGVVGRLAAVLARRPAIYSPHCFPFVGDVSSTRRRFSLAVERALAPVTAALICVCEEERRIALARRIRPRRLEVIHNGCPPCSEPPAEHALRVGAVTVLRRQKRVDLLLNAAAAILAAVPEATIVVAGDGPELPALRAHPAARDPRVVFEPFRPPPARHLRTLDVFVLPSAWEAFPIGVLEAQACGVPQVATDVGGVREAVDERTGVLVPACDAGALAAAVIALLRDGERRARLGAASRARHAERYTLDTMVAMTAAVYDSVRAAA